MPDRPKKNDFCCYENFRDDDDNDGNSSNVFTLKSWNLITVIIELADILRDAKVSFVEIDVVVVLIALVDGIWVITVFMSFHRLR